MIVKRNHPVSRLIAAAIIGLFLAASFAYSSEAVSIPLQQNTEYTVLAGFEDLGANGLEIEAFLPEDVTIRVGDTITWQFPPIEPHTVTFLAGTDRPVESIELPDGRAAFNPAMILPSGPSGDYNGATLINSGFPPADAGPGGFRYSLKFTEEGAYPYVCLLHPFMAGTVTVLPQDAGDIPAPAAVVQAAEVEKQSFISELDEFRAQVGSPGSETRSDGTEEFKVFAGISTPKVDLMYFEQAILEVEPGDTVTWTWNATEAPHNILFIPEGQENPFFLQVEPQEAGPPNFVMNPAAFDPAGSGNFDPDVFQNSGIRFAPHVTPPPGFATGDSYSLTFKDEGTFTYICSLHFQQGMGGTITVKVPFVIPPSVGGYAPSNVFGVIAAVFGVVMLMTGAFVLRRRSRVREIVRG